MSHMHMSGVGMQMITYLHFDLGDALWFAEWTPNSKGAMVGACIGLLLLAIFERLVVAMRSVLEAEWSRRAHELYINGLRSDSTSTDLPIATSSLPTSPTSPSLLDLKERASSSTSSLSDKGVVVAGLPRPAKQSPHPRRKSTPFIAEHDLSRGATYFVQTVLAYSLMLALMSWNAAFLISIVAGLGIGETMFGRFHSLRKWHH